MFERKVTTSARRDLSVFCKVTSPKTFGIEHRFIFTRRGTKKTFYRVSHKKHSYKNFGLEIMLFTCSQTLWSGLRSSFTKWGSAELQRRRSPQPARPQCLRAGEEHDLQSKNFIRVFFLGHPVLAVPPVHLVPVPRLALLAAVGDLLAPSVSLEGDCRVNLLPTKDDTVGTFLFRESLLAPTVCHCWSKLTLF